MSSNLFPSSKHFSFSLYQPSAGKAKKGPLLDLKKTYQIYRYDVIKAKEMTDIKRGGEGRVILWLSCL